MEDLLEEIVGEIDDESDIMTLEDIRIIDEFNYYLNGSLPIEDFNEYFEENIKADDVDTIAGFIIHHIGYVPDSEERVSIRINDYVLTTSEIRNGRIYGVLLNIDEERMIEVDYITQDQAAEETDVEDYEADAEMEEIENA